MKITHISTNDIQGGAARATYRLHRGLIDVGHESRMLVTHKASQDAEIEPVVTNASLPEAVMQRVVSGIGERMSMSNLIPWPRTYLTHAFVASADVVNLHHIHGNSFPYTLLPRLSNRRPVVWTLHDMWAVTGHCGYSYECEKWQTGCGDCPRIAEPVTLRRDTSSMHWHAKRWAYGRSAITVVAPSRWLADLVRTSPLLGNCRVEHIPYGIDTKAFAPIERNVARKILNLPEDLPLILFAADSLHERRKGASEFAEAVGVLASRMEAPFGVVVFGQQSASLDVAGAAIKFDLGSLTDDRMIIAAFSAVDLFVSTSLADNLPNTILESLACGTPIVAYDVGGTPDMVREGVTGRLVPMGAPNALAAAVGGLLADPMLRDDMSREARALAETAFGHELQARRYEDLYGQISAERTPARAA